MNTSSNKQSVIQLIPILICFFVMGFVDLVGTASNYVQKDLALSDAQANFFPSLVFFWFLIFSVPTGMLMNRIGRKKTVLTSLVLTLLSLCVALIDDNYVCMVICFSLLGIGNAVMQTSLNPLVGQLIRGDKLASTLTFGQFVKAIASFLAPVLMAWGASAASPSLGFGWRSIFLIYSVICCISLALLAATPITEEAPDKSSSFYSCFRLLGHPAVLWCFIAIVCHVGIDVGSNTIAPKIIMERLGLPLNDAAFATSIYFIFRTIGCFSGTIILRYLSSRKFMAVSVGLMAASMVVLFFANSLTLIYIGIALVGFGNSNVFSIAFAQSLHNEPEEKNSVSGLMIMGLFGGTIFPLAMGYAADLSGSQCGAISVMALGVIYLVYYIFKIKK